MENKQMDEDKEKNKDNKNITFRFLTPIFNISGFNDFVHMGHYKDTTYNISLKSYGSDPSPNILPEDDLNEFFKYGSEGTYKNLWDMHLSKNFFHRATNTILVVDVVQPKTEKLKVSLNTHEVLKIHRSILSALQIHASKGLSYEHSYLFRSPPIELLQTKHELPAFSASPRYSIFTALQAHYHFSPLGEGVSVLREDQYDECRTTFKKLLEHEWSDSNTFDKVLQLAMDYQNTALCLANVEHGFLILMVAIEALFKKTQTENAPNTTKRIAQILCSDRKTKKSITKEFTAFFRLRNDIAHGEPSLDFATVKEKYPLLYNRLTSAIIALLHLPKDTLSNSYYDDLDTYVEKRYKDFCSTK